MKKCLHCGKKSSLIFTDEEDEEKIYLCRECHNDENKKLKRKMG